MAIETFYHGGIGVRVTDDMQFKTEMTNHPHITEMTKYAALGQINDIVATAIPSVMATMDLGTLIGSNYLTTAALSDHTHNDLYQRTGDYLTTAMASDAGSLYQRAGAYLTTGAQSDHTHSDLYQSKGNYLITAAASDHTHSDLYLPVGNSTQWNTSVLSTKFLTTAAVSDHTHTGVIAPSRKICEIIPGEYLTKVVTVSATQVSKRVIFNPFWLDGNSLRASTVRIIMSWVTNTTPPVMTYGAGLYSRVNETSFALYDSTTAIIDAQSSSNSAQYSGIRMWDITGMTKTLSEGGWLLGLYFNGTASGAMNGILMGASAWPGAVGYIYGTNGAPGLSTAATNNTKHFYPFMGYYSNTTAGFPNNVTIGEISGGRAADAYDFYAQIKEV